MKFFPKKTALVSAIILPFAFGAGAANADLIESWNYTIDNGFANSSFSDGDGRVDTDEAALSWGPDVEDADQRSSVSITSDLAGTVVTNGATEDGGTFTHNNRTIPSSNSLLESFELISDITLTSNGDVVGPTLQFNSFFTETRNSEPCGFESASVCDDIFSLQNPDFGQVTEDGNFAFQDSVIFEDYEYTIFLDIIGLGLLEDDACNVAGAGSNCIGFLTQEGQLNTFQSQFRVEASQVEVPEPGSLALLGLGLVGLGVASRRKKAA